MNSVGPDERKKLWIPNLVFENSPFDAYIKNDALSSLIVHRESPTTLVLNSNLQENEESSGNLNSLEYARKFELELGCDFELHKYPFDTQMCSIVVILFFSFHHFEAFKSNMIPTFENKSKM